MRGVFNKRIAHTCPRMSTHWWQCVVSVNSTHRYKRWGNSHDLQREPCDVAVEAGVRGADMQAVCHVVPGARRRRRPVVAGLPAIRRARFQCAGTYAVKCIVDRREVVENSLVFSWAGNDLVSINLSAHFSAVSR